MASSYSNYAPQPSGFLHSNAEYNLCASQVTTNLFPPFWEDDISETIRQSVNRLKQLFHKDRQLVMKYLPRDVSETDIRQLLSDFPVQSVYLQTGCGSVTAKVSLEDPEMLEEWDIRQAFLLHGQRIPVSPTPTEMLLCVSRLPLSYTESQFETLVKSFGQVCLSFVMVSEHTGASKGYGFVEYTCKEDALQARILLNNKEIEGRTLCCDWLDCSLITFESLHSKCLYVDCLPSNFRDMGKFRKRFSIITNPPYCQIALKNGYPQDWGLVEFNDANDAEATFNAVQNIKLHDCNIRTAYCIPGVRAMSLYSKLLNNLQENQVKGALLPDPPALVVVQQQIQTLAKQNPKFASNLQNIIFNQSRNRPPVHNGQNLKSVHEISTVNASGVIDGTTLPGKGFTKSPTVGVSTCDSSNEAALVVSLAGRMQTQLGSSPSLLGNPHIFATLKNAIKQENAALQINGTCQPSYPKKTAFLTQTAPSNEVNNGTTSVQNPSNFIPKLNLVQHAKTSSDPSFKTNNFVPHLPIGVTGVAPNVPVANVWFDNVLRMTANANAQSICQTLGQNFINKSTTFPLNAQANFQAVGNINNNVSMLSATRPIINTAISVPIPNQKFSPRVPWFYPSYPAIPQTGVAVPSFNYQPPDWPIKTYMASTVTPPVILPRHTPSIGPPLFLPQISQKRKMCHLQQCKMSIGHIPMAVPSEMVDPLAKKMKPH